MLYFIFLIRGPHVKVTWIIFIKLKVLRIWFKGERICKHAEFQKFWSPIHLPPICPTLFQMVTQNSKSSSRFFKGFLQGHQNGLSQPFCTKAHKEDRILANGVLPDQETGGEPNENGHQTQQEDFCPVQTVKIWPISFIMSKVIQFLP